MSTPQRALHGFATEFAESIYVRPRKNVTKDAPDENEGCPLVRAKCIWPTCKANDAKNAVDEGLEDGLDSGA